MKRIFLSIIAFLCLFSTQAQNLLVEVYSGINVTNYDGEEYNAKENNSRAPQPQGLTVCLGVDFASVFEEDFYRIQLSKVNGVKQCSATQPVDGFDLRRS